MDWKIFILIFTSIFIAELGDKSQLAIMLLASDQEASKLTVFIIASIVLILSAAISVLAGNLLSNYINTKYLQYAAGLGFIIIGLLTLYKA